MAYTYRFLAGLTGPVVQRIEDGAFLPADPANADWRAYQAWLDGGNTTEPVAPPPPRRTVTGAEFLALFTPPEVAALWGADPRLMAGALKVAAQDSANLDSPEMAQMMALATAKGALTADRAKQVAAGTPPVP